MAGPAPTPPPAPTLAAPPPSGRLAAAPGAAPTLAAPPPSGRLAAAPGAAPRRIGPYVVERELGRGGMGVVLVVRHPDVPRPLALKLILGEAAGDEALRRFGQEAQVMARVRHPNVVAVHELGRAPEGPYLVADLVEGEALHARLRRGPLAPREAAALVRALADGLSACHAAGVVHRDLKPHNVLVRPDGSPVVLDFGIARDERAERLTRTGQLLGTPAYMAPEQAEGRKDLDARVDVYGLGAILFECLAGRPPFELEGGSLAAVLKRILFEEPRWPSATRPGVPRDLEAVLRVAMAKDREARHPSAAALRDDLDRLLRGERPWAAGQAAGGAGRAPRRALAAAALALAALGLGAAALRRRAGGDAPAGVAAPTSQAPAVDEAAAALARLGALADPEARLRGLDAWLERHRGHARAREARDLLRTASAERAAERDLEALLALDDPHLRGGRAALWLAEHPGHPRRALAEAVAAEARAAAPAAVLEAGDGAAWGFPLDGGRVLTACGPTARLWEASPAGAWRAAQPANPGGAVTAACRTPDGRLVLATQGDQEPPQLVVLGRDGREAQRWGSPLGARLVRALAATDRRVAVAGEGEVVAVVGLDGTPDGGRDLRHEGAKGVLALAFAPDGRALLTACGSTFAATGAAVNDARLWSLDPGASTPAGAPVALDSSPTAAAFAPDGRRAVVGTTNGFLYALTLDADGRLAPRGREGEVGAGDFVGAGAVFAPTGRAASHVGEVRGIAFVGADRFVSAACVISPSGVARPPSEVRAWTFGDRAERLLDVRTTGTVDAPRVERRVRRLEVAVRSLAVGAGRVVLGTEAGEVQVWAAPE